jgi:hypothetical protein
MGFLAKIGTPTQTNNNFDVISDIKDIVWHVIGVHVWLNE